MDTRFVFSDFTGLLSSSNCGIGGRKKLRIHGGGHVQDFHLFDKPFLGHLCRGVAPEGQSPEEGGGLPGNRDNKNCGNSRRNCRSRISASKTTAVRTCRPRCGSHRLSSSPDLRFPGFAWPSRGNPNGRLSPHAEPPRIQWRYRS